jgi:hypothetical protein
MKTKHNLLHLVLKGKWYDMIANGSKKEEYREIKPYWVRRLCTMRKTRSAYDYELNARALDDKNVDVEIKGGSNEACHVLDEYYDTVVFQRGYTAKKMAFKIEDIIIGKGDPKLGAPNGDCFIIKLGEQVRMRTVKVLTL